MANIDKLKQLIMGQRASKTGVAPLFRSQRQAEMLAWLELPDFVSNPRKLGQLEGAIWSLGWQSIEDIERAQEED